MYPGNFGLGPVVILGNRQVVPGVLTLGSEHTTEESRRIWETKPDKGDQALDWTHVYVFTGRSIEQLTEAGVHLRQVRRRPVDGHRGQSGHVRASCCTGRFESDASHALASGHSPRGGLLCLPTLSTHGYEVIKADAIPAMTRVLTEFLLDPVG